MGRYEQNQIYRKQVIDEWKSEKAGELLAGIIGVIGMVLLAIFLNLLGVIK